MKITRRKLRQIIQEVARKSKSVTVEISIESGDLSKDKIQFNSEIYNTFYALRPREQIAKLKIGEKLVFNVSKFWSAEIAPNGSKTVLWDGWIEEARNLIWSELPTDDVILKVTYSTPQVGIDAGRELNMSPEQLRQFVKEELSLLEADTDSDGTLDADELRQLADELEDGTQKLFPPVSHPLIAQYADKAGYNTKGDKDSWFKEYQTYTYSARPNNIQAKQRIVLYYLPSGKYEARIIGSYNNRISAQESGAFDDPIEAIEAALDSSVAGTTTARQLLTPVGEKITGNPTGGAWYD